ncbi:MAG: site-specific integrase [Smithella sp.]
MKGGIYTRQRCPICKSLLNHAIKDSLVCPYHPEIKASRFIVKFKKTFLNFKSYREAERYITGLRFKTDEGSYDPRDYQKNNPLGFSNLIEQWFKDKTSESKNRKGEKERKIKPGTKKNYSYYKASMCAYFGNRNIKELAEDEGFISDYFNSLTEIGNKTKWNYRSALNDFFTWVWRRNKKAFMKAQISQPELPEIRFTLGYRKMVSKDIQYNILEEVKRICPNIKVYLGIKWLCTYIKVRPSEMLSLKEGDINLGTGHLSFPMPKENEWKAVALIPEDIEILNSFPKALPSMPFFRHPAGVKGTPENYPFSKNILYNWWKKACANLGIEGVDLYGGTKHSSVTALRKKYSPEEIKKKGSGHKTNKAFDRYFTIDDDDSRLLYADALPQKVATVLQLKKLQGKKGK